MTIKINGNHVIASGGVVFRQGETVEVAGAFAVRYVYNAAATGVVVNANLVTNDLVEVTYGGFAPGDDFTHTAGITHGSGRKIRLLSCINRLNESSEGPVYRLDFTLYYE